MIAVRLGIIADVHANLDALRAVLARLDRAGVDALVCAGDLVGYGPFPNECVELLGERGALCVAGNHDLVAAGGDGLDRCGPIARATLAWTREALTPAARDALAALPGERRVGGVRIAHGAPGDAWAYVRTAGDARAVLDRVAAEGDGAPFVVLGHTHQPLVVGRRRGALAAGGRPVALRPDEAHVVNPGTAGAPRERRPWARYAVLDLRTRRLEPGAVLLDLSRCRRELARRGLPPEACHLPPARGGRLRAAARRAVRAARRTR